MTTTLPTLYQQIIHQSRYSRFRDDYDVPRREEWNETLDRWFDFWVGRYPEFEDTLRQIRDRIEILDGMPSMRSVMTAGKALDRDEVASFNCAFTVIDSPRAFDELMYILMCGTGIGFSVQSRYVNKLPEVSEDFMETDTTIVVPDSKIGWASSFKELLSLLYVGKVPKYDLSKIRPKGTRLKTFGGRASGPEPLEDLFLFAIDLFRNAAGRKLSTLECHDLACKIADIVVVGGVRRSALISLSDLSDDKMRNCKTGAWWEQNPQRRLANNSYVAEERPDFQVFLDEWTSLYKSFSGERGIFSLPAAQKVAERNGRRDADQIVGTNPCAEILLRDKQMCVAPDTPLITEYGIQEISSIEDQVANIWNGEKWTPVTVIKTGTDRQLMRVRLSDGSYLDCTPNHRWSVKARFQKNWSIVETKDLERFSEQDYPIQVRPANVVSPSFGASIDNAYTLGFAVGDGCVYNGKVFIDCFGEKDTQCPIVGSRHKKYLREGYSVSMTRINASDYLDDDQVARLKSDLGEIGSWNRESVLEFVAGLADADGAQASKGIRIYLSQEHRARQLQLALTRVGIRSSCNLHSKKGTETNFGARNEDLWYVQITKTIDIPCHRLICKNEEEPKFKGKYQTIVDVDLLPGLHDTYCFEEPETHMGLFANVLTHQCNLSEVVVRPDDDLKKLKKKVETATIIGTFQSTLTNFRYLRKKWRDNCEEERLLGVSLTGICDNKVMSGQEGEDKLIKWLEELRQTAIDTNATWADNLGIPRSTAITTIKPSGTVSQLVNSASGIHPRFSKHYIRRIRQNREDPLCDLLIDEGVPYEVDRMDKSSYVFSFPIKSPEDSLTNSDVGAMRQLRLWQIYAKHWCEHKPSMTCYYQDNEFMEIGNWIWNNFDEVSGISFLPLDDHIYPQAPYEPIDEETYNELMKTTIDEIDWTKMANYEKEDNTTSSQELACSAGGCEL